MTRVLCDDVLAADLGADRTLALGELGEAEIGVWGM